MLKQQRILKCCVDSCPIKTGDKVVMHRFPQDGARLQTWVNIIKDKNKQELPDRQYNLICAKHFDATSYLGLNLKKTANPSVFPNNDEVVIQQNIVLSNPPAPSPPEFPRAKTYRYAGDVPEIWDENTKELSPQSAIKIINKDKKMLEAKNKEIKNLKAVNVRLNKKVLRALNQNKPSQMNNKNIYFETTETNETDVDMCENHFIYPKVTTLTELLNELRSNNLLTTNAEEYFEGFDNMQLVDKLKEGKLKGKYPPEIRQFALTLSFYSQKAYEYVRNILGVDLPARSTMQSWYSVIDGKPGVTKEALEAVRLVIEADKKHNKESYFCLLMDEMSIRQKVEEMANDIYGYVNFGDSPKNEECIIADKALVYMLTSVTGTFKIPIAYFFVKGTTAADKANFISALLLLLYEQYEIKVICITFDGPQENVATANKLGANLDPYNLKPYFNIEGIPYNIYVSLDNPHMLKLVRNNFAKQGEFQDGENRSIKFKYLEHLVDLQEEEGLAICPKITRKHIEFKSQIMRVNLAVQMFSVSVANGLKYLSTMLKRNEFLDSGATQEFLLLFNDLFDAFNRYLYRYYIYFLFKLQLRYKIYENLTS